MQWTNFLLSQPIRLIHQVPYFSKSWSSEYLQTKMADYSKKNSLIAPDHIHFVSIDEFYVIKRYLEKEHYVSMRTAAEVRYPSGALVYATRAFTTNIGQMKIFWSKFGITRCQIKDLYTKCHSKQLKLYATIFLIDKGMSVYNVDVESLYEIPQRFNYYVELAPEAKPCRIHLGDPVPLDFEDETISKYFCDYVMKKWKARPDAYKIQILDYKNCKYHVDLIDCHDNSLIRHLRTKFQDKIKHFETITSEAESDYEKEYRYHMEMLNHVRSIRIRGRNRGDPVTSAPQRPKLSYDSLPPDLPKKKTLYRSPHRYFQAKLRENEIDPKKSFMQRRFFKIRILTWSGPEAIFIIPDDPDYYGNHEEFRKELESCMKVTKIEKEGKMRKFRVGQKCLFKNSFDPSLGLWLRGIIVSVPKTRNGLLDSKQNGEISDDLNDFQQILDSLIYRVLSYDYGFECARSTVSIRHVENEEIFSIGPWSMKCRLFGINPLLKDIGEKSNRALPDSCISMTDNWIRERQVDGSNYYMLFRSEFFDIDSTPDVTIFHKFEHPYTIEDCILPKRNRSRYDSLNSFLINNGFATDYVHKMDKSSRVELDQYVINLLVSHNMIE